MSLSVQFSAIFARTMLSGRYWSRRISPISPMGMTSMMVRSKPSSPHHAIMASNSSSFMPFSATILILTSSSASLAAARPVITLSSLPQRVMDWNLAGSRVSRETLMRRTPASLRSPACLASWVALVVSVNSSSSPERVSSPSRRTSQMMLRRTNGSPPVRRSLRTPRRTKARHRRSSSSNDRTSLLGRKVMSSDMQ